VANYTVDMKKLEGYINVFDSLLKEFVKLLKIVKKIFISYHQLDIIS